MRTFLCRLLIVGVSISLGITSSLGAAGNWQAPFDTISTVESAREADSILTFSEVIKLVASRNPTFRALEFRGEAAQALLKQAGLWSNPDLGLEAEEVGWDAPGLKESEISVTLSQQFELFGQRGARKNLAKIQITGVHLQGKLAAFDLYLESKERFYGLAHAQELLNLAHRSVQLADSIVGNIQFRIEKGAALQSELLLATLESQRARLALEQAEQEVASARELLAALWSGTAKNTSVVADTEPDFSDALNTATTLHSQLDSTRTMLLLKQETDLLKAEQSLAAAEARPPISLSGGYKRLEGTNSNSFLFGISLPLPLLNRNQGTRAQLRAEQRALEYTVQRERVEIGAEVQTQILRLRQLVQRHDQLDSLLLPTAEDAYTTLQDAYQAGRVPYTQLLEAERSLNELRFEHNDVLLDIHTQVMAIERTTGAAIYIDKENK